jgi:hypothetical protein
MIPPEHFEHDFPADEWWCEHCQQMCYRGIDGLMCNCCYAPTTSDREDDSVPDRRGSPNTPR